MIINTILFRLFITIIIIIFLHLFKLCIAVDYSEQYRVLLAGTDVSLDLGYPAHIVKGRVSFGAADSAPLLRRWIFGRRGYSTPELFF